MSFPTEALFPTDTLLAKDSLAGKEERQRQKRPQQVTGPVHVFTAREQCFFLRQVGDEQKEHDGGCDQHPPHRVRAHPDFLVHGSSSIDRAACFISASRSPVLFVAPLYARPPRSLWRRGIRGGCPEPASEYMS